MAINDQKARIYVRTWLSSPLISAVPCPRTSRSSIRELKAASGHSHVRTVPPPSVRRPRVGVFNRSRGRWRGSRRLAGRALPRAVAGARAGPDTDALAVAKLLPAVWSSNHEAVAQALVEHLAPYREAVDAGEVDPPSRPLPVITEPTDAWQFVELLSASVTPLGGKLISEVALAANWDEEHTLGARFHGAAFVELNGSILAE